jgi:catechol 2,3-dioxygenase-like lactoylglutathione lyase family enzyme
VLNQVNIVARDWDASLAFYRLLGFDPHSGVRATRSSAIPTATWSA